MKLYLFATVLCSLVAAIAAAPAGEDPAGDTAFAANGVSEGFSSLQFSESGGRNQTAITLYEDGKVEGTIVLNSEGLPVAAYDASGNAIDAALLDADDEEVGFQTMARPSLGDLKRIWDFIKKHGRRARVRFPLIRKKGVSR